MNDETVNSVSHQITKSVCKIVLNTCSRADDCVIEEDYDGTRLTITVVPHTADFRVLCGKDGKYFNSMDQLVRAAGRKEKLNASFVLEESFMGDPGPFRPFKPNPAFDLESAMQIINKFAKLCMTRPILEASNGADCIHVRASAISQERHLIAALAEVIYPMAFNMGAKIKIRPVRI